MATEKTNVSPVENEALGIETVDVTVNVTVRGVGGKVENKDVTLKDIPVDLLDANFEVSEYFDEGKNVKAFIALIGEQNRAILKANGVTIRDFNKIMEAWKEAAGLGED
nr:MAG TPA: hypothetical protein [Caudoviricetes sp.]